MLFSIEDMIEIVFTYGECGRSYSVTVRRLQEKFPGRADEFYISSVQRVIVRFKDTGDVRILPRVRNSFKQNKELSNAVVEQVMENPHTSTRAVTLQVDVSQSTVSRILKSLKFHPYKLQLYQQLVEADFEKRIDFCNFMNERPEDYAHILFSDESYFKNYGDVNSHNMQYCSIENPHWVREV
jgi:hypothetical protein